MAATMELNLGSPRTKAAMKVLGVKPFEVKKLDLAEFEGQEGKFKMMEQKRLNVIADVKQMVAKSPNVTKGGDQPLLDATAMREAKTKEFLEVIEAQEAANFENMQRMAKKDVQGIIIGELTAKKNAFIGAEKQKASQQRMKELLAQRDAELAARKKEALKKQEKNEAVRERYNAALIERNKKMAESLANAQAKCANKIQEIHDQRVEAMSGNDAKRREVRDRLDDFEAGLQRGREDAYKEIVVKHETKMANLEEKASQRQSDAALIAERQRQSTERVKERLEKAEVESRLKYMEAVGRHAEAAKKRDADLKQRVKEYTVGNVKKRQAHEGRFQKIESELEAHPGVKLCASSAPGSPTSVVDRADKRRASPTSFNSSYRSMSETNIRSVMDHRRNHGEVVGMNKERLRRAHHYGQMEQIDKLQNMRKRVEIMQDAKSEADKRRMVVLRNTSLQKMELTEKVSRVRDSADPEKMNRMLEELDPDVEAVDKINEMLKHMGMQQMAGGTQKEEEEKR